MFEIIEALSIELFVSDEPVRGVSDLWSSVNHVALVVSDVGTSLSFYTDVVGFQQVMRPNFDRLVFFAFIYVLKKYKFVNLILSYMFQAINMIFQAWRMAYNEQR